MQTISTRPMINEIQQIVQYNQIYILCKGVPIGCACWAVDPCAEVFDELFPFVQEEEDEDGGHCEYDHQQEVEYFGYFLWA